MTDNLDEILPEDPYLAAFVGTNAVEQPETGPAQWILYPMLTDVSRGPDDERGETYEWGRVVNLREAQVPFMDLTWIDSHSGWAADDWSQFDSLADEEKLELGLPLGLLIVPIPFASEEEWEAEYSTCLSCG